MQISRGDYDIRKAFAKIENELLESMIRNMKLHRAEEKKEGYQWAQWQTMQLHGLNEYKKRNHKKFLFRFQDINNKIRIAILRANAMGKMAQEVGILKAIKEGAGLLRRPSDKISGEFFKTNDRKLNALVDATVHDMEKAEQAILRMHDDKVRKAIFNAQVYANTGAGTYEKAVDMAVKDYVAAGINCVKYRNGRQVNIKDYADMALRTANKRAYLAGEGEKRQEWGVHTVIMNKRGNPCPLCLPWAGKILIDDVWSGGTEKEAEASGYPLMSHAMSAGLYHPSCKDVHTTYFEGISTPPSSKWTKKELEEIKEQYARKQKAGYAKRQEEKFARLEEFALDDDNRREYAVKKDGYRKQAAIYAEKVEKLPGTGIIKKTGEKIKMDLQFFAEKDIQNQNSSSLKRSIRKFNKRIEEHEHKISHPEECFPNWEEYSTQYQEGLKRHWRKEIKNFSQSVDIRIEELKKRGDYDGKDVE